MECKHNSTAAQTRPGYEARRVSFFTIQLSSRIVIVQSHITWYYARPLLAGSLRGSWDVCSGILSADFRSVHRNIALDHVIPASSRQTKFTWQLDWNEKRADGGNTGARRAPFLTLQCKGLQWYLRGGGPWNIHPE